MYIYLIIYFIYIFLRSKQSFHMLQQNFYNNSNRYLKWINNNKYKTFITYDLLFILVVIVAYFYPRYNILFSLFNLILIVYYIRSTKKAKIPLKVTSRIKRMGVTLLIIYGLLTWLFITNNSLYSYALFAFVGAMNSFLIYYINIINKPVEKIVYLYYYNKAKQKINNNNRLKVIGITGSYGKTSSKNIIYDILSYKYDTLKTPMNYNTPYGLMKTINNNMDKFNEYFIAEMGACEVGQIKELCDFVHPSYGILTKIGVAHLDSFKTEENIQKTKFELIESLPSNGIGILNKDDPKQVSYELKNNCQILWVSLKDKSADIYADNIKFTYQGTSFDIHLKNDKKVYSMKTKLLGEANVYNIMAGIILSLNLGMNMEEIKNSVNQIKPIEHRLELKRVGDLNIIDDAYNSNPIGSKMALDTLALMPGKKVVVTPGMIELKDQEYELNKEFGKQISKVADYVILVGKKQTKAINDGLEESKYNLDQVKTVDSINDAFALLHQMKENNIYVLLENDLPDIFNE